MGRPYRASAMRLYVLGMYLFVLGATSVGANDTEKTRRACIPRGAGTKPSSETSGRGAVRVALVKNTLEGQGASSYVDGGRVGV